MNQKVGTVTSTLMIMLRKHQRRRAIEYGITSTQNYLQ